jgi:hypothetical protein
MSAKNFIFLLFLISSVPILIGVDELITSLTNENVFQATDAYALSGHADKESISFTNWDSNDPPVVPASCARCHSTTGILDFLGENGSTFGVVDREVPVGEVITCSACHNPSSHRLNRVSFHSGVELEPVGTEAICLVCHQSRQSGPGVQEILDGLEEDEISEDLNFINPHYNFAASTQFGSAAHSGYEYPTLEYSGYFIHAANASTCTDCHNAHNLQVDPYKCAICHVNVVTREDFRDIRMQKIDFDGNGNTSEGIYFEINALTVRLLEAIQEYARQVAGTPVVYADQFPYFFIDTNENGEVDHNEMNFSNRYTSWTPRMLRAAYNYQFAEKDAGGYIHNPRYMIQLLHDSLVDLARQTDQAVIDLIRP